MTRLALDTPTAHCDSCRAHLQEVLTEVDGVLAADLDLTTRTTTVDFDPAVLDAARITALVEEAGYPVGAAGRG